MSKAPTKAAQFLAAMKQSEVPEYEAPPAPLSESIEEAAAPPQTAVVRELPRPKPPKVKLPQRAGLKHFGGYLDDDTLEKIALLRVRLRKDNSELIKQAIEDLYRKHNAKRVFGDA